jgi:PemK-like, MazF-like toxin of type II toxin-antitoxin system
VRSQNRGSPYEIELGKLRFLRELSVANIQGIGSIPAIRLQRKLGSLSTETLNKIKQTLRSAWICKFTEFEWFNRFAPFKALRRFKMVFAESRGG